MSKKSNFIDMVEHLLSSISNEDAGFNESYSEGLVYFDALKTSKESEKPQFTDNGKLILGYMKTNADLHNNMFKAKDIAEGIFVSSRSVSGAIRKLVTDGYVEKVGQDPIVYSLTELGKTVVIE